MTAPSYTVVVPTVGRDSLHDLLRALDHSAGPAPAEIVVVDDRPAGDRLPLPAEVTLLCSGGRGPAAARNVGWRHAATEWVVFLDDDVVVPPDWRRRLAGDLAGLAEDVGATQGRIVVPPPASGLRPTDAERNTGRLAGARWITADIAYRWNALAAVGGFDERFPRAYREDADLALRVQRADWRMVQGGRETVHPARAGGFFASVRAQRGNADDALLRHKFGAGWRRSIGEGRGRLPVHLLTTAAMAAAAAMAVRPRTRGPALVAAAGWLALTAEFAVRRTLAGPRTWREIGRMALTSVLIPPVAVGHRLRGEVTVRAARAPRGAVLFDRDDTLIENRPYLADARQVRPVPGAAAALRALRAAGVRVGVVSNQSGVARGLITPDQLAGVQARVEELLGPFDTWQVCVHDDEDDCACRKPKPGLVCQALRVLGTRPAECVVIGDTGADVTAALAAGARPILVPTPVTRRTEVEHATRTARVAGDITEAVAIALVELAGVTAR